MVYLTIRPLISFYRRLAVHAGATNLYLTRQLASNSKAVATERVQSVIESAEQRAHRLGEMRYCSPISP